MQMFTLEQVTKSPWGYVSSTLSLTSVLDGGGDQSHAPAALPPGMTRYNSYVYSRDAEYVQLYLHTTNTPPHGSVRYRICYFFY
jgi:hypothetical protein